MTSLPDTVSPYRTIGPFTEDTLPVGLLKEHSTKAGVWGLLEVAEGQIRYIVTEEGHEASHLLTKGRPGVIVPQQNHHLELVGPVRFQITFHKGAKA